MKREETFFLICAIPVVLIVEQQIRESLQSIAEEKQVKIVYACESGSRAWGFPSPDSDYDVRFLYVQPQEWYLSINIEKKRDVIERLIDDTLDLSGWDIRKALSLLRQSNVALFEWLGSPVVYKNEYGVADAMRTLAQHHYSPQACFYHYFNMAKGNWAKCAEGEQTNIKRYLYVLRPLLAAQWVEHGLGIAPTEFGKLVERLVNAPALKLEIEQCVRAKRHRQELDTIPRVTLFDEFITQELERLKEVTIPFHRPKFPMEELNTLFRTTLAKTWEVKL